MSIEEEIVKPSFLLQIFQKILDKFAALSLYFTLNSRVTALMASMEEIKKGNQAMSDKIDSFSSRIDSVDQILNIYKTEVETKNRLREFQEKIKMIGFVAIDSYPDLDSSMQSMILSGCESTSEIFSDILRTGVKGLNVRIIKLRLVSELKKIRSQYTQYPVDPKFSEAIKEKVAYPILEEFEPKLESLRRGLYNGRTDEVFQDACFNFVQTFISKSIHEYKKVK